MKLLKQSTAETVKIGPFLDATDGVSEETALSPGVEISKDGAAFASKNEATTPTHDTEGWYNCNLDATDTNTLGSLILKSQDSATHLPVWHEYTVVTANIYDSWVSGTDTLQADVTQISGAAVSTTTAQLGVNVVQVSEDATAADNLELQFDGTGLTGDTYPIDQLMYYELKALIESQRQRHTVQGNIYFVSPNNGDTHANGNRGGWSDPYNSIQDALDNAVTDSNHDLVYLVADSGAGTTTITEDVTVSKAYTQIRGPGRDMIVQAATNTHTFSITANGVSLEGFRIQTTGTGSGRGINASGADFVGVKRVWLENTQGDGIRLTNCSNAVIEDNNLQGAGQSGSGNGIVVVAGAGQNSSYCNIINNFVDDTPNSGVKIDTTGSGTVTSTRIIKNKVFNAAIGVEIVDANTTSSVISDNRFAGNTVDYSNADTTASFQFNEQLITSIYLDTVNGDDGDPGTAAQPVATVARAKAIADDLNKTITVVAGSSFTLGGNYDSYVFKGSGYTVALGGQSISGARFENATINGIGTGANRPTFALCEIGTVTLPPSIFTQCRYTVSLTAGSSGDWTIDFCESGVPGSGAPTFNFASLGNNNINITNWARGLTLSGLAAGDVATPNGVFNTLTLNGADATVNVSGQYGTLTNNLTGSPTVSITNAFKAGDVASILDDTGTSGVIVATNNDKTGYALSAAGVDAVWDEIIFGNKTARTLLKLAAGGGTLGTAVSSTSTTIVLNGDASAVDDLYNRESIGIVDGTGAGQYRYITDYDGTTKTATVSEAWTINPDNTSEYLILATDAYVHGLDSTGIADVNTAVDTAFTTQMADSVPTDGTIATREQALYLLLQFLTERAVTATTMTIRKVDGSTTLATFTLDDADNPTSITRAS